MMANRQLPLPLQDAKESQLDRLRRILAGVPKVQTAGKYFDAKTAKEAEAIAKAT